MSSLLSQQFHEKHYAYDKERVDSLSDDTLREIFHVGKICKTDSGAVGKVDFLGKLPVLGEGIWLGLELFQAHGQKTVMVDPRSAAKMRQLQQSKIAKHTKSQGRRRGRVTGLSFTGQDLHEIRKDTAHSGLTRHFNCDPRLAYLVHLSCTRPPWATTSKSPTKMSNNLSTDALTASRDLFKPLEFLSLSTHNEGEEDDDHDDDASGFSYHRNEHHSSLHVAVPCTPSNFSLHVDHLSPGKRTQMHRGELYKEYYDELQMVPLNMYNHIQYVSHEAAKRGLVPAPRRPFWSAADGFDDVLMKKQVASNVRQHLDDADHHIVRAYEEKQNAQETKQNIHDHHRGMKLYRVADHFALGKILENVQSVSDLGSYLYISNSGNGKSTTSQEGKQTKSTSTAKAHQAAHATALVEITVSDNLAQVRVFFRWICDHIAMVGFMSPQASSRHTSPLSSKRTVRPHTPQHTHTVQEAELHIAQTLKSKAADSYGFAELFGRLCTDAGFPSMMLHGHLRTLSHDNRDSVITKNDHWWNAIYVDEKWILVDCCMSAGVVSQRNGLFQPDFADSYFNPRPESFILDHFPLHAVKMQLAMNGCFSRGDCPEEIEKYPVSYFQLLDTHKTLLDFENGPTVSRYFGESHVVVKGISSGRICHEPTSSTFSFQMEHSVHSPAFIALKCDADVSNRSVSDMKANNCQVLPLHQFTHEQIHGKLTRLQDLEDEKARKQDALLLTSSRARAKHASAVKHAAKQGARMKLPKRSPDVKEKVQRSTTRRSSLIEQNTVVHTRTQLPLMPAPTLGHQHVAFELNVCAGRFYSPQQPGQPAQCDVRLCLPARGVYHVSISVNRPEPGQKESQEDYVMQKVTIFTFIVVASLGLYDVVTPRLPIRGGKRAAAVIAKNMENVSSGKMVMRVKRNHLRNTYCGYLCPVITGGPLPQLQEPSSGVFILHNSLDFCFVVDADVEAIVVVNGGEWMHLKMKQFELAAPSRSKKKKGKSASDTSRVVFSGTLPVLNVPDIWVYQRRFGVFTLVYTYFHAVRDLDIRPTDMEAVTPVTSSQPPDKKVMSSKAYFNMNNTLSTTLGGVSGGGKVNLNTTNNFRTRTIATPRNADSTTPAKKSIFDRTQVITFPEHVLPRISPGRIILHPRAFTCGFHVHRPFVSSRHLFCLVQTHTRMLLKAVLVKGHHYTLQDKVNKRKESKLQFFPVTTRPVDPTTGITTHLHPTPLQAHIAAAEELVATQPQHNQFRYTFWRVGSLFSKVLQESERKCSYTLVLYVMNRNADLYDVAGLFHFNTTHDLLTHS